MMKRQDFLWTVLPGLLIVGSIVPLRFYVAKQKKLAEALEAPYPNFKGSYPPRRRILPRLTVEKVEKRALSPKDVYDGFDTHVVVTLGHRGAEPKWWKTAGRIDVLDWNSAGFYLSSKANANLRTNAVRFQPRHEVKFLYPQYNAAANKYEAGILMKLGDVLRNKNRLVLRVPAPPVKVLSTPSPITVPAATGPAPAVSSASAIYMASPNTKCVVDAPLIFTVLKPRETIKAPTVSRDSPVEVTGIEIRKQNQANATSSISSYTIRVTLHFRSKDLPNQKGKWNEGEFEGDLPQASMGLSSINKANFGIGPNILVGGKGKRIARGFGYYDVEKHEGVHQWKLSGYAKDLATIVASERDLTIRQIYNAGNSWPQEIRIPLRRNGKDVLGFLGKSQFQTAPAKASDTH